MDNSLSNQMESFIKKNQAPQFSIREINLTYFFFLLLTSLTVLFLPIIGEKVKISASIMIASFSIFFSIPLLVFAIKKGRASKRAKYLFYLVFACISVSVLFSCNAIIVHNKISINLTQAALVVLPLAGVCTVDFLFLSLGKLERLLFSLLTLLYLAAIVLAFVLLSPELGNNIMITVATYGGAILLLHLTMLLYVFVGEHFFELMSLSYLIVGLVVLVIALIVVSGDGSCDCADCGDLSSGRRNKNKKANKALDK